MKNFKLMKSDQNIYKSALKRENAIIEDGITQDMRFTTNIWETILAEFDTKEKALEELKGYKSVADDMGRFYEISEYYIEEYTLDEYGEETSNGIWEFAKLK